MTSTRPTRPNPPLSAAAAVTLAAAIRAAADRVHGTHGGSGTPGDRGDRGDVPGWVLVTLMTAGLVAGLWALADTALTEMFTDAMASVQAR